MTRDPVCFPAIVSVGYVYDTLKLCRHHSFPITDREEIGREEEGDRGYGRLLGTVPRKVDEL
jgi:hypothetical protein